MCQNPSQSSRGGFSPYSPRGVRAAKLLISLRTPVHKKRKNLTVWLPGFLILILCGCGQNENASETIHNYAREESNAASAVPDTETNDKELTINNLPPEDLPEPSEVPINSQTEEIHYYSGDSLDLLRALHRCVSDGKNIYLTYGGPDLYIMPAGTDRHTPADIDNPEGLDVCNIALDTYGNIHLLMAKDNREWFIWQLDKDLQVGRIIDISAYFETGQMPLWFLVNKSGCYFLQWVKDRDGMIIDGKGSLTHRFTPESLGTGWIYEAATGRDGQFYLLYRNAEEKMEIGKLDAEECYIEKGNPVLSSAGNEVFNAMAGGTDTTLVLFSPYTGIWAYDNENGSMENRVPISAIGFDPGTEFWPLAFLPDGRLLLLGQTAKDHPAAHTDNENTKHWLFKYIPCIAHHNGN